MGEALILEQQEGCSQVVGQVGDRFPDRLRAFPGFQLRGRARGVIGQVIQWRLFVFVRLQSHFGMTFFPSHVVAGKIRGNGEKPAGKPRRGRIPMTAFVNPHESLQGQIEGIFVASQLAQQIARQRLLPTSHDLV